jgi:hypothetical protein
MAEQLQSAALAACDELSYDERLQRTRRIDWRFLLDSPALGEVACVGEPDAALCEALGEFAAAFHPLGDGPVPRATFDVVVVPSARAHALDDALAGVRPGGHVYIETEISAPGERIRGGTAARACARLRRDGDFGDLRRHWHWPDFRECRVMLDLDAPAALHRFLTAKWPGARGRAIAATARGLAAFGVADRLASHCSVIARRSQP